MRTNLRKFILAPVVLAAAVLATTTANAEVIMKVPFNFSAGGKICPAGLYSVQKDLVNGLVTLRSRDTTAAAFTFVLGPGDSKANSSQVTLKFDEVGDAHALRTVEYGHMTTSRLDGKANVSERASMQTVVAR